MSTVFCEKLQKEGDSLAHQPYPGELGQRIQTSCCKEAWQLWLEHQTMLINEHRLNVLEPSAKSFLENEMEQYFFGKGSEAPAGYQPPTD